MKRVFLLIVVPALLVALGFAQTPAASGNANQMNIKGCLGGSDGHYTVAEDNTGQIFNITTSSADLKAHVGQDVKLIGQKADAAQNSVAVTELNMISEHCTAAAAAPAAAVSTPSENLSTPPASAAPAAAPDASVSTAPASAAPAAAPDATVSTAPASAAPTAAPDATVSTPPASAAPAAAPAATVSTAPASAAPTAAPDATVSTASASAAPAAAPAAAVAVHPSRRSARLRKPSETPTVAAAPPEPVSTPSATAPVAPPSETTNIPAAPAAATNASTSRSAGMLVFIVVVVLLIGTAVPLYNRWRKRKLLEQTKGQNLSFTKEAKSDPGKSDTTGGRKVA
jgi:hypothetical protein